MVVKGCLACAFPGLFSSDIRGDLMHVESFSVGEEENISESSNANVVFPDEEHPEIATVSAFGVIWMTPPSFVVRCGSGELIFSSDSTKYNICFCWLE